MKIDTLERLLREHGIPVDSWGNGKAKPISSLAVEIDNGETDLQVVQGNLERLVKIVKIHCTDGRVPGRGRLIEVSQQLPDGRIRPRGQEPSGKIKIGESPMVALARELMEELELSSDDYDVATGEVVIEKNESLSYPGLITTFEIHHFGVVLKLGSLALLDSSFSVKDPTDGSILFFEWQP